jgi:hypothetical protein
MIEQYKSNKARTIGFAIALVLVGGICAWKLVVR